MADGTLAKWGRFVTDAPSTLIGSAAFAGIIAARHRPPELSTHTY
jgi:hypothetical protein